MGIYVNGYDRTSEEETNSTKYFQGASNEIV